jgi:hypothetical protein
LGGQQKNKRGEIAGKWNLIGRPTKKKEKMGAQERLNGDNECYRVIQGIYCV